MFQKLRDALKKTHDKIASGLKGLLTIGRKLDDSLLDELEEKLIGSDMGPEAALAIMERVRAAYKNREIREAAQVWDFLKAHLKQLLQEDQEAKVRTAATPPTVLLVAGVNGSGKTTSIAKLAWWFRQQGKSVLLAASDTFRAAAVEQLGIWADRLGVGIVKHTRGADPAAVAFDALEAAVARKVDVLIVDTAGRLHTQEHLMQELQKIRRVLQKRLPDAPHEVLLVLDATTGQNAIAQARTFRQAIEVTGLIVAKLDGTAKGGAVIGIRSQVPIPVKFIGVGEKPEDIEPFDAAAFVEALLE
jgi:fused signal recognition particle receptor